MKAKTLPLFIALAALGLTACGPTVSESSGTTTETSETPVQTDTSETTPPPTPVADWTDEEKARIESVLGEGHPIPYYDFAGNGYEHEITVDADSYGDPIIVITVLEGDRDLVTDFIASQTEGGIYEDTTLLYGDQVVDGQYVLDGTYDDASTVQAQVALCDEEGYILDTTVEEGIFQAVYIPVSIIVKEWPAEEITGLIEEATDIADVVLPVPTLEGEHGYAAYLGYDANYNSYAVVDITGNATSYSEDLLAAGYTEIPDIVDGGKYYVSPDEAICVYVWDYDFMSGITTIQIGLNDLIVNWPEGKIAAFLDTLAEDGTATVLPALPNPVNFYQVDDYMASYGIYYIYAYGEDQVDAYVQVLLDAGFTAAAYIDGEFYYGDPKGDYLVNVAYDPDYGTTDIYLSEWFANYVTSWPTDTIATIVSSYSETAPTLPEPAFEWQFGTMYENMDGSFNIDLADVAADGSFVEHADEYAAQLNAAGSGWTYDTEKDVWLDSTGEVMVTVYDDPDYGTSIYVETNPYVETYAELGVGNELTALGYTGTLPALEGGDYYEKVVGEDSLTIIGYGLGQTELDAYFETLVAAGWNHSYNADFGHFFWDAANQITLQAVYDSTTGSVQLFLQPYDLWGYTEARFQNATMLVTLFYGIEIPGLPLDETTPVYLTMGIEEYFIAYVFGTDIADEYGELLIAAGYTLDETPVAGTTASYTLVDGNGFLWSMRITVDTANNCTTIALY